MRDARSAGVAALGLAACLVVGWAALRAHAPPRPADATAAAESFSAARAADTVAALAGAPRPMGSAAHGAARRHLVGLFEAMGLETTLEPATVLRFRRGGLLGARVVNIVARLEGSGRRGAILLMAHYDSVPGSPGAGDDASGVAAIVEAVRAIVAGPPLERDLLVLLTDGEEAGLLGARAFVRDRDRLAEIDLVLNFEARGGGGAVNMFETSGGNHRLVEELGRAAPWPMASSLSYEVYRRMPNDTDFSILRRTGLAGLNFAMIGRYASYHTSLDTVERLSAASLQHHGSYALSLARHFGDLAELPPAGVDGVYFNLLGSRLFASYSSDAARFLAVLLTLIAAVALTARSRRHRGRLLGVGWGALLFAGATLSGLAAALAIWRGLGLLAPALRQAPHGVPWISGWLVLAGGLLTVGLVVALVRLLSALAEAADLWAGVLVVWTLAAVTTAFLLPGGSYVFLWPALAGWLALWVAERLSGSRRRRALVATLAALPAVVLLAPVAGQLFEALTVRQAGPALVLLAWVATLLVVPLAELTAWGRNWVETGLAAGALAVLAIASLTAGATASTPATSELFYLLDADVGRALWVTGDRVPSPWIDAFVPPTAAAESLGELLPGRRGTVRQGSAPAIPLARPVATFEPVGDQPGRVRLRLVSPRGAAVLHARLTGERPFRLARVDGEAPPPELPAAGREGADELMLTFFAPPSKGIELELETGLGGDGHGDGEGDGDDGERTRWELRLADQTWGLPAIDGAVPRRPAERMPPASWVSDSILVSTRRVWPEPLSATGPAVPGAEDGAPGVTAAPSEAADG